eukprot:1118595-Amphidinium_carterae.1
MNNNKIRLSNFQCRRQQLWSRGDLVRRPSADTGAEAIDGRHRHERGRCQPRHAVARSAALWSP